MVFLLYKCFNIKDQFSKHVNRGILAFKKSIMSIVHVNGFGRSEAKIDLNIQVHYFFFIIINRIIFLIVLSKISMTSAILLVVFIDKNYI